MNDHPDETGTEPPSSVTLRTPCLLLRPWRDEDREPFAAMNADPEVMRYFQSTLDRTASDRLVERIRGLFERREFSPWAVEIPGTAPFIGFAGLFVPDFNAPFMPCVEVGWRLAREHWGKGYATEAARAAMRHGFDQSGLEEIVAYTVERNAASRRVMEKLGMRRNPAEDFEHPKLEPGHPLRPHVLYRISKLEFARTE